MVNNQLGFFATTAGSDTAIYMGFEYGIAGLVAGPDTGPILDSASVPAALDLRGARLGDLSGSAFDLIATLVTLTVAPGTWRVNSKAGEARHSSGFIRSRWLARPGPGSRR